MIGIIDADLVQQQTRYPNLALMKISSYYKQKNRSVKLLLNYENLEEFKKIFISKVFTFTKVPPEVLKKKNVIFGGTGFFWEKAKPLSNKIEHSYPDYQLYQSYVKNQLDQDKPRRFFKKYLDYSTGFTTRGCFRKCEFCVNKNYNKVLPHSPIQEFLNSDLPLINLLDDNIFGYKNWKKVFYSLQETQKRFVFTQGLDIRLLNEEKIETLTNSKYCTPYVFAFDNYQDKKIIIKKLELFRKHIPSKPVELFLLCSFPKASIKDLKGILKRINILRSFNCYGLIMRFEKEKIPKNLRQIYSALFSYCFLKSFYKNSSFKNFILWRIIGDKKLKDSKNISKKEQRKFLKEEPEIWTILKELEKDREFKELINKK